MRLSFPMPGPRLLGVLVLALWAPGPHAAPPGAPAYAQQPSYFTGKLLVAAPEIADPRFRKAVLYMVKHDAGGAIGIIVNKRHGRKPLGEVMRAFGLEHEGAAGAIDLHFGGPVAPRGAFILHTGDYAHARSHRVAGAISFTTNAGILRDVAAGEGPRRILFALGYAGWGAGQLGDEIARGDWSIAEPSEDLVFGGGEGYPWDRVVEGSEVPL